MPEPVSATKPTSFKPVAFVLNVGGTDIYFNQLTEISSEMELVDYRDSSVEGETTVRRMPGKQLPPTLVLTRPFGADQSAATWHQAAVAGDHAKSSQDGVLSILDIEGKPLAQYSLEGAWPTKIEIAGSSGSGLVETVTLTCERLERLAI